MLVVTALSVFIISGEIMAFDPETGELVKNANCEQYHSKINDSITQLNELPRADVGSSEAKNIDKQAKNLTDKAKKAQSDAYKKGCQPDPNWAPRAGSFNPQHAATNERHQYVPATASESGVPMNFDFIGMIGGLIGQITGGAGSIFPAVKGAFSGKAGMGLPANPNPYDTSGSESEE